MGVINYIKSIFKKEERLEYPYEYCIVTYNQSALRNGVEDLPNKIIIRYKYDKRVGRIAIARVYPYSDSLLHNIRLKLKIPVFDQTEKEINFPIYDDVNLDEVSYIKG